MKKNRKIPADIIEKTREYAYSLAGNSSNSEFETNHLKEVEENIVRLSIDRKLDPDAAVLIALLHDIGRTKCGIYGKGHAKAGAAEAFEFLKGRGLEEKKCKKISKAISNHNKKKKIHGDYSELIKDADSMTVYQGGVSADESDPAYQRGRYACSGKCTIRYNPEADIPGIIKNRIAAIGVCLDKMLGNGPSPSLVHETRINIRMLRSLIWCLKRNVRKNMWISMELMDDELKDIFRDYGRIRKMHVLRKNVIKAGGTEELADYLKKIGKKEKRVLKKRILERHRDVVDDIAERMEEIAPYIGVFDPQKIVQGFKFPQRIKKVKADDMKSLHRFRILCKKLIYLNDMEVIEFYDERALEAMNSLHNLIGRMNDNEENLRLINKLKKKKPAGVRRSLYDDIARKLSEGKEIRRLISEKILLLHLMF